MKDDSLGTVQEIEFWPYEQMVYKSVLENVTHKVLSNFEVQTDRLISAWRPNQVIVNNKKKREPAEYWTWSCQQTTD